MCCFYINYINVVLVDIIQTVSIRILNMAMNTFYNIYNSGDVFKLFESSRFVSKLQMVFLDTISKHTSVPCVYG